MSFFPEEEPVNGIVYIINMVLDDGTKICKIGITARPIKERLAEIMLAHFDKYRYIPRTSVKRFTRSFKYKSIERELHKEFEAWRHSFELPFTGSTEFFQLDEKNYELLLYKYKLLMDEV